ncbi:hypothetical protein M2323_003656 [Rhodoblastus acidophilus]|uniref:hypothetical protein n=1 Tax=Rhodoblastus acidophilus TaxID=1074 RepID=UPI001614B42D|nr:hypothetical protein [Rhodoblastus acidophilus]MCW2285820.1 hypothetical protein [Rhodoblastus acidophilus]MCW2334714.1 hypothetical protein [Rhodoblastus acidophilus]
MSGEAEKCAACVYWKMARPNEGSCQRHAPTPAYVSDSVAHWPTTHGGQGCGEFLVQGSAVDLAVCAECRYWRSPKGGLDPTDRGDKPLQWWGRAGLCTRHAPAPQSEPGPRAFWRATHATDLCAESIRRAAQVS